MNNQIIGLASQIKTKMESIRKILHTKYGQYIFVIPGADMNSLEQQKIKLNELGDKLEELESYLRKINLPDMRIGMHHTVEKGLIEVEIKKDDKGNEILHITTTASQYMLRKIKDVDTNIEGYNDIVAFEQRVENENTSI